MRPVIVIKNNVQFDLPQENEELGLKLSFVKINPESGTIGIDWREKKKEQRDYIIMKAIVFPYINLLWGGTIIMVIGFLLSIFHRLKTKQA